MAASNMDARQTANVVAKFDELLSCVDSIIDSKLVAGLKVASSSTINSGLPADRLAVYEDVLLKLATQKEALLKKKAHRLQLVEIQKKTCRKDEQTEAVTVERLRQKLMAAEQECARVMTQKTLYDQESRIVASLKTQVRQNIDKQIELVENKLKQANEQLSPAAQSGLSVKSADKQRLVVEFINSTDDEPASVSMVTIDDEFHLLKRPSTSLEFTITYTQPSTPCLRITNVSVNVDTFTIDDLVHEAVSTNDIFSLFASIRQRWMKHSRLAAEIEPLRHKYALDWVFAEGIIRVLYGGDASIVCTLQLNNYPEFGSSGLTLRSASGLPPGVSFDSLQIPASVSLKKALEFLESHLSTAGSEHRQ